MGLDLNELRQENHRLANQGQGNYLDNFVKMPEGDGAVTVRLLPPKKGNKLYCVTRTHKLNSKNFHCLQTLVGDRWQGHCPICIYYRKLWRDSDQLGGEAQANLQAEARSIKPIERYYYNSIVRQVVNKDQTIEKDVGPKILSIGQKLHQRIIRAIIGDPSVEEPELGDVTDVNKGRDFKIIKKVVKSGADGFPNYDTSKFLAESVLGTAEQVKGWLENLHDLTNLRQLKTFEELTHELNVFRGLEPDPELSPESSRTTVAVSAPPPKVNVVKEEADESLADADFIAELRGLK